MTIDNKKLLWVSIILFSVSLVLSTLIATMGIVKIKSHKSTIIVTGSAKKQIKSDFIVWKSSFDVQSKDIQEAYQGLKENQGKVKEYLLNKGVKENEIVFSPVTTIVNYVILQNGQFSSEIDSYKLVQELEIRSSEVEKYTNISRESTELINQGVKFQSFAPQYFYTKIADFKISMVALATKDAKNRAEQIASNTGSKIDSLYSAKMGVFQITPLYSNDISDYGTNDTSSIDKEVMAVMNCEFQIKK